MTDVLFALLADGSWEVAWDLCEQEGCTLPLGDGEQLRKRWGWGGTWTGLCARSYPSCDSLRMLYTWCEDGVKMGKRRRSTAARL